MSSTKNAKAAKMLMVAFFLVIFPVAAVLFSKWGLDTYRDIRSEMRLYKDSIAIPDFEAQTYTGQQLSKASLQGKMLLVHFAPALSDMGTQHVLGQLEPIQKIFNQEDKRRYQILSFVSDSMPSMQAQMFQTQIDTFNWKLVPLAADRLESLQKQFRLAGDTLTGTVVLVDSKGKICDLYNMANVQSVEKLKIHMSIVVPKKERKRIEYRADKDPYQ